MKRTNLSVGSRFLTIKLFVVAFSLPLSAQNVRVGTVDHGELYAIPAETTTQSMTFTEDGATATATADAQWNGRITMNAAGTLRTAGVLTVNGGIEGSGDLTITGDGALLLHSASIQTGRTILNGMTVRAGKDKVFSAASPLALNSRTVTVGGATWEVDSILDLNDTTQEIASLSGSGNIWFGNNGHGRLTVGGNDSHTTFTGNFVDAGTLEKIGRGTMILNGNSLFNAINLDVAAGTLAVNGDFNAPGSTATVQSGATLGGSGNLFDVNVESGGTLAPGTRLGYAVLATDTLTIDNDLTLESGSTLSIRVDAAGNSDRVIVEGTFANLDGNANLEIDALAGEYTTVRTYDAFLVATTGSTDFNPDNIFLRQRFLELRNVNPNSFQMERTTDYFTDRARGANQRTVAAAFDRTGTAGLWRPMTNIAASTNQEDIDAAYREISGAVNANSLMLGQWRTSSYALRHLDLTRCGMSQDYAFWLETVHQTTDFAADFNSNPYGISRTGFLLGGEERRDDCVFGMLGGYSQGRLYSQGDKFTADDTQFGFYAGTKAFGCLDTKVHIGYGHQEYHSRRFLRSPLLVEDGDAQRINGKFSGDSMSMTLEFAVPYSWAIFEIKPLFAIDSDLTWQYGYAEVGDTGCELGFGRNFFDRTFIRVGAEGQIGSVNGYTPITLTGRLTYSSQVGGNPFPITRSVFLADPTMTMRIHGLDPGREFINCGIGFRWNFDHSRSFYGDYDFSGSKRSCGHFASLGYVQKW